MGLYYACFLHYYETSLVYSSGMIEVCSLPVGILLPFFFSLHFFTYSDLFLLVSLMKL